MASLHTVKRNDRDIPEQIIESSEVRLLLSRNGNDVSCANYINEVIVGTQSSAILGDYVVHHHVVNNYYPTTSKASSHTINDAAASNSPLAHLPYQTNSSPSGKVINSHL